MDCKTVDAGLVKRGKWKFTGTDKMAMFINARIVN